MNWRRNLWILCITNFFANIAFNMTSPFLPELLRVIGVSEKIPFWAGILTSATFLAYALMSPVWGNLADRCGRRPMLLRSSLGIGASYVMMVFAGSLPFLLAARLLNGLLSGFTPASIILVSVCTPSEQVGYALGILNMAVAAGSILGPLAGGILTELLGVRMALAGAGVLMVLVALGSYYGTWEPAALPSKKTSIREDAGYVICNPKLMIPIFCMLVLNMAVFILQPVLPLFVGSLRVGKAQFMVGLVFSISAVSLAIASPIINKMHNNRKRPVSYLAILIASLVLAGLVSVTQGLSKSIPFLISQRFLFGAFQGGITIAANVLVAVNSDEAMRGRVFGMMTSITAIGFILGPVIGGLLAEQWGYRAAFFAPAVLFLTAALYLGQWSYRSKTFVSEGLLRDDSPFSPGGPVRLRPEVKQIKSPCQTAEAVDDLD
jgi:DHA1 family multidrug resistance protein-like MFS transporter